MVDGAQMNIITETYGSKILLTSYKNMGGLWYLQCVVSHDAVQGYYRTLIVPIQTMYDLINKVRSLACEFLRISAVDKLLPKDGCSKSALYRWKKLK
jgi:hypothetical protein